MDLKTLRKINRSSEACKHLSALLSLQGQILLPL